MFKNVPHVKKMWQEVCASEAFAEYQQFRHDLI